MKFANAIGGIAMQPVVDIRTGAIIYREMLVRFSDSRNVQDAILEAERARTVQHIDLAILQSAVELLNSSDEHGVLGVNLSPVTVELCGDRIIEMIAALGELTRFLVIEITETAPIMLPVAFGDFSRAMLALGVRFAVDDYGTGFCDTARVMFLRAKFIKVPKNGPYGWAGMMPAHRLAILALAAEHEAAMIAEGVETAADLEVVCALGLDGAQGYYFAKPRLIEGARISLASNYGSCDLAAIG
jgi:EAL domain-containing protein (putative c-di-GMP-specific phosphodiesterase class I)